MSKEHLIKRQNGWTIDLQERLYLVATELLQGKSRMPNKKWDQVSLILGVTKSGNACRSMYFQKVKPAMERTDKELNVVNSDDIAIDKQFDEIYMPDKNKSKITPEMIFDLLLEINECLKRIESAWTTSIYYQNSSDTKE